MINSQNRCGVLEQLFWDLCVDEQTHYSKLSNWSVAPLPNSIHWKKYQRNDILVVIRWPSQLDDISRVYVIHLISWHVLPHSSEKHPGQTLTSESLKPAGVHLLLILAWYSHTTSNENRRYEDRVHRSDQDTHVRVLRTEYSHAADIRMIFFKRTRSSILDPFSIIGCSCENPTMI